MVYVLSKNGQPIMPTENHAKVRLLLKSGKAKVVRRTPLVKKASCLDGVQAAASIFAS